MATHIFIEKENGETGTASSKDRLKLRSAPSKSFVERSCPKTPLVGRTANVNPATSQSVRKALGILNRPPTTKSQCSKGKKYSTKKATETTSRMEGCSMVPEDCPEKENLFSYNPLDFESFEVSEEHRLSHMSLTGVPLMVFENASDSFASTIPIPMKQPSIPWGYDTLQSTQDFLATLDEIIIDLPPPL
ncbi:securin [Rhineura floridana]|uniref:securin n=1 Tax=Rhineura floridana TaxID=261503 RepID=UPI002AC85EB0|nr:securin [Rhineura floridana]XP_061472742.1 securin [Rhineura floridana]XP_061472743.1 securin [Rhineura floridana]XP_061472744.1 securin [Rhineura floridana]XP_061472745.1 securin [Rhineura floridana]